MTDQEVIRAFLQQAGKKGGEAKTEAKKAAVRENGKKGGRPPKKTKKDD